MSRSSSSITHVHDEASQAVMQQLANANNGLRQKEKPRKAAETGAAQR